MDIEFRLRISNKWEWGYKGVEFLTGSLRQYQLCLGFIALSFVYRSYQQDRMLHGRSL